MPRELRAGEIRRIDQVVTEGMGGAQLRVWSPRQDAEGRYSLHLDGGDPSFPGFATNTLALRSFRWLIAEDRRTAYWMNPSTGQAMTAHLRPLNQWPARWGVVDVPMPDGSVRVDRIRVYLGEWSLTELITVWPDNEPVTDSEGHPIFCTRWVILGPDGARMDIENRPYYALKQLAALHLGPYRQAESHATWAGDASFSSHTVGAHGYSEADAGLMVGFGLAAAWARAWLDRGSRNGDDEAEVMKSCAERLGTFHADIDPDRLLAGAMKAEPEFPEDFTWSRPIRRDGPYGVTAEALACAQRAREINEEHRASLQASAQALMAHAKNELPEGAALHISPIHLAVDHRPRLIATESDVQVSVMRDAYRPYGDLPSLRVYQDQVRELIDAFLRNDLPEGYGVRVDLLV